MWHDAVLDGSTVTQALHRRWGNGLRNSIIAPLHQDPLKKAEKGILTRAEFGLAAAALGVEVVKWPPSEQGSLARFLIYTRR
jgi:hypothetical protein